MTKHIAILRGDGIGPEIVAETVRVLDKLIEQGLDVSYEYAPLGGEAYDEYGHPYPEFTQNLCRKADAVLLGAVGSPQYDNLDRPLRPERGLLAIRKDLNLFANLRPAILYKELANASTLKPEIVAGLDILIVRELTGDIYFGEPRGIRVLENGEREGYNTMKYSESEIRRIAHVAFQSAQKRSKKVCSVGKANVLENCGAKSLKKSAKNTLMSSFPICTSTMPPCSWYARPNNLTSSPPATSSATSSPTKPPC